MKTISIRGKEYYTVNERLLYFKEHYPEGYITTKIVAQDENTVTIKATVKPEVGRSFTGHAYEDKRDGYINKTSHVENCETSAVGRALAMMGIGIVNSVASADEVVNAKAKMEYMAPPKKIIKGTPEPKEPGSAPF